MIEQNTEERILEAARLVFIEKGFDGARMQEIADKANINKAMLHYYYRTKDKLFKRVFEDAFKSFVPRMGTILLSDNDILEKIRLFISNYIDLLIEHPFLPLFIMKEVSRNPKIIENIIPFKFSEAIEVFQVFIDDEFAKGKIKKVNVIHLIINIVSLCIFPFVAQPMLTTLFDIESEEYKLLMIDRKNEVFNIIKLWLRS